MEINRKTLRSIFFGVGGCIILYWLLHETERVQSVFQVAADLIAPFVAGAVLAFALNVPMRGIEKQLTEIEKPGVRRGVAILMTLAAILIIVVLVVQLVVPQVWDTCMTLGKQIPGFIERAYIALMDILEEYPELEVVVLEKLGFTPDMDSKVIINQVVSWVTSFAGQIADKLASAVGTLITAVETMVSTIWDIIVTVIFSLYCLSSKETLVRQGRKLAYAVMPERWADNTIRVLRLSNSTFSNFFGGQCLEVCILGGMFYVTMSIFGMPYAPLVSVLVAVTAFVPLVGAFIGCALGAFFILVDSPLLAVYFVIMFLVLQQIENNLIYPRVVGNSVGLPSMWVLIAVTVGGGLMGVIGMILMIPFSSVLYTLAREYTGKRVAKLGVDPAKLEPQPPELESNFKRRREARKQQRIREMMKKINLPGKDKHEE